MEAITILKNEANNHRLMQIDLDELVNNEAQLENFMTLLLLKCVKVKNQFRGNRQNRNFLMKAKSNYVSHTNKEIRPKGVVTNTATI